MGANNFMFECLLPLKLVSCVLSQRFQAKDITEKHKVNIAGTVIGVSLGSSFLLNTILFANVTFAIDRIVQSTNYSACVLLCFLLIGSNAALYKPVRRELRQIKWVRKLCCKRDGELKSYRIKNRD